MCEYIGYRNKYTYHLLTCLPTGTKCVKSLYGKDLPKGYLYHDVNSNQLIKKNTQLYKDEFPYIVITGEKVTILPNSVKDYYVVKILERLNRIKR